MSLTEKNLLAIGATLIGFVLISLIVNFVFNKIVLRFSSWVAKKLSPLFKWKYSLLVLEVLFFASLICYPLILLPDSVRAIINHVTPNFMKIIVTSFVFILFILIESDLFLILRQGNPDCISIIKVFPKDLNNRNYFLNRFTLFIVQVANSFFLIVAIYVVLVFLRDLTWDNINVYFYALVLIPVLCNIWIYLNYKIRLHKSEIILARRTILYIVFGYFSLIDIYGKFSNFTNDTVSDKLSFDKIFIYVLVGVFAVIDKIVKDLASDYDKNKDNFPKEKNKNNGMEGCSSVNAEHSFKINFYGGSSTMPQFEKYARIETSESIAIYNEEFEVLKLDINFKPFSEILKRVKDDQDTQALCISVSNKNKEGEDDIEIAMGLTIDDAEFLHAALGRLLRRFKNEELID